MQRPTSCKPLAPAHPAQQPFRVSYNCLPWLFYYLLFASPTPSILPALTGPTQSTTTKLRPPVSMSALCYCRLSCYFRLTATTLAPCMPLIFMQRWQPLLKQAFHDYQSTALCALTFPNTLSSSWPSSLPRCAITIFHQPACSASFCLVSSTPCALYMQLPV